MLTMLILAMTTLVTTSVETYECPIKLWKKLESMYEENTMGAKITLVKKCYRCEMSEGANAEQHVRNMSEMCARLQAMGSPVLEDWQILFLLASLPPSSTPLVASFSVQAKDLDLATVEAAIIDDRGKAWIWPES